MQNDSSEESEDRESEWTLVRRDCMSNYTHTHRNMHINRPAMQDKKQRNT